MGLAGTVAGVIDLCDAVDARGIAARRGKMDVQILCFHIRELALYRRFDVGAFDDLPARHPRNIIEDVRLRDIAAESQRPLLGVNRFRRQRRSRHAAALGSVCCARRERTGGREPTIPLMKSRRRIAFLKA